LTDPYWSVRGAAGIALGNVGRPEDLPRLLERLRDDHPWPRRGAIYALGRLGLSEAAPRIREELTDDAPEVRLAAVWALGRLADDGAREELVRLLYASRPPDALPSVEPGDEGGLVSDAESRLFDAVVQALGRLGRGAPDPLVRRALADARDRLTEEELDRLARLPLPETAPDRAPPTVRHLFESALPTSVDDEDG
jgi:HEAT repeat protein